MDINFLLAKNIRSIRTAKHLSQEQLAHDSELQTSQISKLEVGQGNPTVRNVAKVAKGLNVPIAALFGDSKIDDDSDAKSYEKMLSTTFSKIPASKQKRAYELMLLLADTLCEDDLNEIQE